MNAPTLENLPVTPPAALVIDLASAEKNIFSYTFNNACFAGKCWCLEFDASSYWQLMLIDEQRCDVCYFWEILGLSQSNEFDITMTSA